MREKCRIVLAVIVVSASVCLCISCTPASDLVTPRDVVLDAGTFSASGMTIAVQQNGEEQAVELLANRFFFALTTSTETPVLSMKVELQNTDVSSGDKLNSVYFRAEALPVDGKYYSLSGEPTNPTQNNAAKLVFYERGSLVAVVPQAVQGTMDNFRVSVRSKDNRTVGGTFLCTVVLPPTNRTVVVSGSFTAKY